eukprot:360408-Pelagomonas_calceolata.AAC.1
MDGDTDVIVSEVRVHSQLKARTVAETDGTVWQSCLASEFFLYSLFFNCDMDVIVSLRCAHQLDFAEF